MWRATLVVGIFVGCSLVAAAELQVCDPVSAHPAGKIVCRPFVPSSDSSTVNPSPPPVSNADAEHAIQQLFDTYGKRQVLAALRTKKNGAITIYVGNAFRPYYGSPDLAYITPQTILRDLEDLHLSPTKFGEYIQGEAARAEQKRQAVAQQSQQEAAERERKKASESTLKAEEQPQRSQEKSRIPIYRDRPKDTSSGSSSPPQRHQEVSGLILPIQPTEATCTQLGQGAEAFAMHRDRGTSASDLISQFTAAATKTPGVVGEFWESVMRSIILQIYANTSWTPTVARQRIELACLAERRAAPSMERGQLTDWEVVCKAQGEAAYVIVQARDRGIAYTALLNIVRDSYRQGPADLAPVMDQWFATVGLALYEQRGVQPETARQQVEVGCLKALQKK